MIFVESPDVDTSKITDVRFIVPVQSSDSLHWVHNRISFYYVYNITSYKEYIYSYNHNDSNIYRELTFTNNDFIYNKKYTRQDNGIEAKALMWICDKTISKFRINHLYKDLKLTYIHDCVPIMKLIEQCKALKDDFIINYNNFKYFDTLAHYSRYVDSLAKIELAGLYTINGNFEYSEYNPFTSTARPSNAYGGINYAALPDTESVRGKYVSRFGSSGRLINVDMRAYHVNLINKLTGYEFPNDVSDVYDYLNTYYNSDDGKTETFRRLYGGIFDDEIPFFKHVRNLNNILWQKYINNELYSILFKLHFPYNSDIKKNKIFNYIIQNFETEYNSTILYNLLERLHKFESKLILYTYDSFLFDVNEAEYSDVLNIISDVLNGEKYTLKVGMSYFK